MSELNNLANRVNQDIIKKDVEDVDDLLNEFADNDELISESDLLEKGFTDMKKAHVDISSDLTDDLSGLGDLDFNMDDLADFDMEIGDLGIDDLIDQIEEIDFTKNEQSILGLGDIKIEKSEEEVIGIINYINKEINRYNILVDSLNELEKTKYLYVTGNNQKIELEQTIRGGGGIYTIENCDKLENLHRELVTDRTNITPQMITSRLNMIGKGLMSDMWILLEEISHNLNENETMYNKRLNTEEKQLVAKEVSKILGVIKPIVVNIKQSLHLNDTAKSNAMDELHQLNKKISLINGMDAFYEIVDITEVTDGNTTSNEIRDYIEVTAVLTRLLNNNLTRKEASKYKEKISVRLPVGAEGATMELMCITNARVEATYKAICEDQGIDDEIYILKPFAYKYKNALVTFGSQGDFLEFKTLVRPMVDELRRNRSNLKDLMVSVVAGKETYGGRYLERYKAPELEYTRYTEREISKMLESKMVWNNMQEYVNICTQPQKGREILHAYDTPCRRFLLGVLEEYPANKDIDVVYNKNKIEILKGFLPIALPYLANYANHVSGRLKNTDESLDMTMDVASDLITFGRPAAGFISKYMTNADTGEELTLGELLQREDILTQIKLSDILGTAQEAYKSADPNKKVVHSKNKPSNFCVMVLDSVERLSGLNVDNLGSINRKGKKKMENKVLVLAGIDTKEDHIKYLRTIAKSIIDTRDVGADIDVDSIVEAYRNSIEPNTEIVPKENIYFAHQVNSIGEVVENNNWLEFKQLFEDANKQILIGNADDESIIDVIKSSELAEIISSESFMNLELEGTGLLRDIQDVTMLFSLVDEYADKIMSYFKAASEEDLKRYERGTLQELIGLPGPTKQQIQGTNTYNLEEIEGDMEYTVNEMLRGFKLNNYPSTLIRDTISLEKIIGNEEQMTKLGSERPERMVERTLKTRIETLLAYTSLPVIKTGRWDTTILEKYVDIILKQICLSNIEYSLIRQNINLKLYYQNLSVARKNIEDQLEDYFIEPSEEFEEVLKHQNLMYWVDAVQVLPIEIYMMVKSDRDNKLEALKGILKKKPAIVEGQRELGMKKKRYNAYYKLYLESGDVKYLRFVDRNYVDFDLLTRQPTADGKPGGEFSTMELIKQYDLEEELDGSPGDYSYMEIMLLVEKKNKDIVNILPEPIVNFIEKDTTVSVLDPEVIDVMRRDSSFNLNYKTF